MRDAVFDYVLSREGIEPFENQTGFVRECARVPKAGRSPRQTRCAVGAVEPFPHRATQPSNRGLAHEVQTRRAAAGARLYHGHLFSDRFRCASFF
jgi:ubiquinone/menaquinone biosynthesis C-methylase UbiE